MVLNEVDLIDLKLVLEFDKRALFNLQGNNLQQAAYSTCWYEYSDSEKKMLQLMILRTQKPNGMNAFQYFHCDNATFAAVY